MEIRFLEIAQVEFDEAVEYYNSESPGLGEEFLLETLKAIERIKLFSNAWHSFSKELSINNLNTMLDGDIISAWSRKG